MLHGLYHGKCCRLKLYTLVIKHIFQLKQLIVCKKDWREWGDVYKRQIKGDFEKKGYKLEVSVIEDPIASNNAIEEGSLEANFIQHLSLIHI